MSKTVRPLWVTGVARSGSNLLGRMLDAHPDVVLAIDPYLPLFRRFRDVVAEGRVALSEPLQDYYFGDIATMDGIQAAGLDRSLAPDQREEFAKACRPRTILECPDLAARLDELSGSSFREVFDRALGLIASVRGSADWVGFKELWIVEFFSPLARAYPQARFVILHRDPRSVLASLVQMGRHDPTQMAHPLSYARHWRKTVAFDLHYARRPELAGRVMSVRYEDLVTRPDETAGRLCSFLQIPFDPRMLQVERLVDPATGRPWIGNSSYGPDGGGIATGRAERWRSVLEPSMVRMIEALCGPEMRAAGYAAERTVGPDEQVRRCLARTNDGTYSWRSDSGDPELEFAREVGRWGLLQRGSGDPDEIRRAFLFQDVFDRLRS